MSGDDTAAVVRAENSRRSGRTYNERSSLRRHISKEKCERRSSTRAAIRIRSHNPAIRQTERRRPRKQGQASLKAGARYRTRRCSITIDVRTEWYVRSRQRRRRPCSFCRSSVGYRRGHLRAATVMLHWRASQGPTFRGELILSAHRRTSSVHLRIDTKGGVCRNGRVGSPVVKIPVIDVDRVFLERSDWYCEVRVQG